jgi:hypothetical protein
VLERIDEALRCRCPGLNPCLPSPSAALFNS